MYMDIYNACNPMERCTTRRKDYERVTIAQGTYDRTATQVYCAKVLYITVLVLAIDIIVVQRNLSLYNSGKVIYQSS